MLSIIIFIVLGIFLLFLEIAFIPGGVVGVIGGIFAVLGIVQAYTQLGVKEGSIFLAITFLSFLLIVYFCNKFGLWSKFALKQKIDSKVNEGQHSELKIGDIGKATSALRPGGNVEFGNKIFEVQTLGHFCDAGPEVTIIKIENNKIFVEPIK